MSYVTNRRNFLPHLKKLGKHIREFTNETRQEEEDVKIESYWITALKVSISYGFKLQQFLTSQLPFYPWNKFYMIESPFTIYIGVPLEELNTDVDNWNHIVPSNS